MRGCWRPNRTATYWPPHLWPSALCLSCSPDAQPEARGLSFLLSAGFSTTSCHQRVSKLTGEGVPKASSAGCWFSLPHLVSNSSDLELTRSPEGPFYRVVAFSTTSCLRRLWSSTLCLPVLTELYNSSIAHSISILMAIQAGICHFRRLWTRMFNHHQAEITVMQFRGHSLPVHQSMSVPWDFTLSHIFRQARLRDFFSLLPSECVTSFRWITLEWHVWLGRRSIYYISIYLSIYISISRLIYIYIYIYIYSW